MTDVKYKIINSYIQAYVWWCGDDICDCTQPKIVRIDETLVEDNRFREQVFTTYPETVLWEGEYRNQESGAEEELENARLEILPNLLESTGLPLKENRQL